MEPDSHGHDAHRLAQCCRSDTVKREVQSHTFSGSTRRVDYQSRAVNVRHHPAPALGVADRPGVKTMETRSWPAPARLVGQTNAIHAGRRSVTLDIL